MNSGNRSIPHFIKPPVWLWEPLQRLPQWGRTLIFYLFPRLFQPQPWAIKKWIRLAFVLAVAAFVIAVMREGIVHVRENQVGILVNNLTGELQLKDRVGYHLFAPGLADFYVLEKTIQKMDLAWSAQRGGPPRDIKLKTRDGSNVSLDITLNFKLMPEKAVTVLTRSGPGMQFVHLWLESYARHISLETFGELSTEEMYDAQHRNAKAEECLNKINRSLNPQGIEVIAFIPGAIRFYEEYETVIQEKKLADQQVEEQQAQARAALQDQQRRIVEEQKKADVQLRQVEGENLNRIIHARAEAEKTQLSAEQYFQTTLLLADAALYSASASAEGIRANKTAEAEGMEKIREALAGEGGLGIIGLEYARRMNDTRFSGTPITRDPHIQQFSVQPDTPPGLLQRVSPAGNDPASGGEQ
ncbi:MAG TPA: SPFH domain-containing protein [bacterium]|nr:SPFH domain-containing protein [bacterium]HXK95398.1 SPFH domain-containing protein [bacterium]